MELVSVSYTMGTAAAQVDPGEHGMTVMRHPLVSMSQSYFVLSLYLNSMTGNIRSTCSFFNTILCIELTDPRHVQLFHSREIAIKTVY